MSVNKVILVGNLGQDPEIKSTNDGRELATFSLATSEFWKDKNTGEKRDKTEWHRIVVFSQGLVGIIKNYVKKGSKIYIEGQLQTRKWTDNSGVEKYTTEIVLQNFNSSLQLLDSKNSNSGGGYDSGSQNSNSNFSNNSSPQQGNNPAAAVADDMDDDIPF
ncbi:MAG: single-strand DNA-binding protein [Lentimonas sp.]|jgi:single-strand DNA-binding protein